MSMTTIEESLVLAERCAYLRELDVVPSLRPSIVSRKCMPSLDSPGVMPMGKVWSPRVVTLSRLGLAAALLGASPSGSAGAIDFLRSIQVA